MLSNLGLFYIILIALFAVPLMGAFVVVIIKGVLDFRYAIMLAGALIVIVLFYYAVKLSRHIIRKIKEDGLFAGKAMKEQMGKGEPLQISMLGGLITFSYGGQAPNDRNLLTDGENNTVDLLPYDVEKESQPSDVINKIKELHEMKDMGIIDDDEFKQLKSKLIQE